MFNVVDVETLQPLKLTVELEYLSRRGETVREVRVSPLFRKTNDVWRRITIKNEDYYKLNFEIQNACKMRFLFVRKKFFHQIDIRELKNLVVSPVSKLETGMVKAVLKSSYLWSYFQVLVREMGGTSSLRFELGLDRQVTLGTAAQPPQAVQCQHVREPGNELCPDGGAVCSEVCRNILAKYLTAVYRILRKGKSSLLPIYLTYFFGFREGQAPEQSANHPSDFRFALNAKLILSFEYFLSLLTHKWAY
jgi:hypothetical protein